MPTIPFHDIPAFAPADLNNPAALVRKLEAMREQVQLVIGTRGPGRGNPAWFNAMRDARLIDNDGNPLPPDGGPGDTTPPPVPTGLTVTPGINHIFVEWTPPGYTQGDGNSITTIYGAVYGGTGPLPTFASAVALASVPFGTQIYALPTEPNVTWHIWVTFTSYANVEGPPAGGTNGASCTSGKLDGAQHFEALTITNALIANLAVDDAKIANLSVSKLIAGSIAVGEYIQSSGFISGVQGFRISGNGNAELNNAIFRGLIEADAGLIGGLVIDASGVESTNYVLGVSGFRLDNATGTVFANDVVLPDGTATSRFDAIDSGVIYSVSAGATNWSSGVQTLLTETTSGDPVTVIGTIVIVPEMEDTTIAFYEVSAGIRIDGSPVLSSTSARLTVPAIPNGSFREAKVTLPLLARVTLPSGSHDFEYIAEVDHFYTSAGATVTLGAGSHSVVVDVSFVVTENHI